jgi:uncharacterized OB-fold protein
VQPHTFLRGDKNMMEDSPFTIESFYKFLRERKLMATKCSKCETLFLPPRSMCNKCLSTNFKWVKLEGRGELISYTVIHLSSEQFQSETPYIIGIVKLNEDLNLPGIIRDVHPKKIRIGMKLLVDFDTSISPQWPQWSRYFFKLDELSS